MPLYEALDPGRSEIRLLEILSLSNDDPVLKCRLVVASLEDNPSYIALSYVWGDPSVTENIVVNGSIMAITSNLASALQTIRNTMVVDGDRRKQEAPASVRTGGSDTTSSIRLWADAICVNQTDFSERNQQVSLMSMIYQSATMVISWLGPGDEQITRTLYSLEDSATLDWMKEFPQIWEIDEDEDLNDFCSGLMALIALPYWRRIWIIQEMVYAKMLVLMSADSAGFPVLWVWFQAMIRFLYFIASGELSRPKFIPSRSWALLSIPGQFESRATKLVGHIQQELARGMKMTNMRQFLNTLYHQATDPKDKIYALLAFMELDVPVDYSDRTTVRDVYGAFAAKFVAAGSTSELLSISGIGWDLLRANNLPSWVPDLQALSRAPASSACVFGHVPVVSHPNANRNLNSSEWRFTGSYNLHAYGCITGWVDQVHRRCAEYPSPSKEYFLNTCIKLISKMNSSKDKQVSPLLGSIFRTLVHDTDPRTAQPLYSSPSRVIEVAKIFLYAILGVNLDKQADLEEFKLLGYNSSEESFEEFFQRQFLPEVKNIDPSEYSYAYIRGSRSGYLLDMHSDESCYSILYEINNNLLMKRLFHTSGGQVGFGPA